MGGVSPRTDMHSAIGAAAGGTTDPGAGAAPSQGTDVPMRSFDGISVERLRAELRVPQLHLLASTGSTLDVAHRLGAAGAPHGTLVLADQQTHGRGRGGKSWSSPPGTGLWITVLVRPAATAVPRLMTVRLGLAAAAVLDRFAPQPIGIKWPNDLYVGDRKLAGLLVEARWRGDRPDWLAVGMGINVTAAAHVRRGAALGAGARRLEVLRVLLPAIRSAIDRPDPLLDAGELASYDARDLARDARCVEPVAGTVRGITPDAELIIDTATGTTTVASGSLVLAEDA